MDSPSGLGLNAIVDDIDTKLKDRFVQGTDVEATNDVPIWNGTGWSFNKLKAASIDSESATDNFVLTADGAGGAAWEGASSSGGTSNLYNNAVLR